MRARRCDQHHRAGPAGLRRPADQGGHRGFHLGFPTTPAKNVEATANAFRDLDVATVVPMHCSGLRSHAHMSASLHDRYVQPAVGTVFRFGGGAR